MYKRILLAIAFTVATGVASAAPVSYQIDAGHTDVVATWSHLGFSHPMANFGQAKGTIVYDAANIGASSVNVTLPLAGVDSMVPALDEHLRSADFFDAAKYPDITFRSTRVEAAGAGKLRVTGNLTVHGVSKPSVLDVTLNGAGVHPMTKRQAIGFDATTSLKRSDFGIAKYVPNVSDEIAIRITTEAMVAESDDAKAGRPKMTIPPKKK